MSLNFRMIIFSSVMLGLFFLVGCGNQAYEDAMNVGLESVGKDEWTEAIEHFEAALKENSDDEEAKTAIEQVALLQAGMEVMMVGDIEEGVKKIEEVADATHKIEVIIDKAEEILTYVEKTKGNLAEIEELAEQADYETAIEELEDLQENDSEEKYMAVFEGHISDLEKEVKKEKLLSYMEGYVATENDHGQVIACEVTNSDIVCGLILIDLYYLATFDKSEWLSDDRLRLKMIDGSTVDVTDITETSFRMHGYSFEVADKEEINKSIEYTTLDEHLDREKIKGIFDKGLGGDVFEVYPMEEANSESSNEEVMASPGQDSEKSSLEAYTDEEIMYASLWFDRKSSPSYIPDLRVYFAKKGDRVNPYTEEAIAYPEDVVILRGMAPSDGRITFSINEDGTINEYVVPPKWNFSSDEEILEETLKAIDSAQVKEVPSVSEDAILQVLESMEVNY